MSLFLYMTLSLNVMRPESKSNKFETFCYPYIFIHLQDITSITGVLCTELSLQDAARPSCDSPNTSPRFALGSTIIHLVQRQPGTRHAPSGLRTDTRSMINTNKGGKRRLLGPSTHGIILQTPHALMHVHTQSSLFCLQLSSILYLSPALDFSR